MSKPTKPISISKLAAGRYIEVDGKLFDNYEDAHAYLDATHPNWRAEYQAKLKDFFSDLRKRMDPPT